jgi:hypothetical protein
MWSCASTSTHYSLGSAAEWNKDVAAPASSVDANAKSDADLADLDASGETLAPIAEPAPTAAPSYNQHEPGEPYEHTWEVTISGNGSNDKKFENGAFNAAVSLSKFLTNTFELGVRQNVSYSDNGNTFWNGSTALAADFNFGTGHLRPFLGANVGYVYGDLVHDTWEAAPEVGLKWYASRDVFLQLLAEYQFFFDKASQANNTFDDGQFIYSLGFGVNF